MSSHVLQCPLCSQPFGVMPEHAGQAVRCPSCNQAVRVPVELGLPASSPPPFAPEPKSEVFGCPMCQGKFAILPEMYGQQVRCPHCEAAVLIQSDPSTTPLARTDAQKPITPALNFEPAPSGEADDEVDESDLFAPGYKPKPEAEPAKSNVKLKKWRSRDSNSPIPPQSIADSTSPVPHPGTATPPELPPLTTGISQVFEPELEESGSTPTGEKKADHEDISHLLPPKFGVMDPQLFSFRNRNNPDHKVILPDGKGGLSSVDDRIVTITHKGEEIKLISLPPDQLRRKRQIQNTVVIVIASIILAIVFVLLRKSA